MKFLIKIYLFVFVGILLSMIYLYTLLYQTESKLNNNMEALFLKQAKEIASNISNHLHEYIHHDTYTELKNQPQLREQIEHSLTTAITSNYQYVYILYRDKNGDFHYLLDGSKNDKGEFGETFRVMSPKWDQAYDSQKRTIIHQTDVDILSLTYLQPFVVDGKTEAIIAIDFSVNFPQSIKEATKPMREILIYIFIAIGLLLIVLLYQIVLNYKIKKDSLIDPLTQIYNRHYLRDFLNKIRTNRYQLIMLDIDFFKKINDNYGHDAGDYVLKNVAKLIKNEVRTEDILVRFGGEEFLLFIKRDKNNDKLAIEVAQRIRKKLEKKEFDFNGAKINVTVSAGITLHLDHFKSINDAIKHADNMLYIAKREGRNKVIFIKPEENALRRNYELQEINDIKEAIENKDLFCQFQAIYDIENNYIVKYEALVRLREKNKTIIYPKEFISTIAHTAIYRDMTKVVLEIVLRTIQEKKVYISINMNFSDILDDSIYIMILNALQEQSQLAKWLTIELLEYEPLNENRIVKERLFEIKTYGVKIAIDDFGSGYANYDVFNFIPVDIIKIDASLIKNINKTKTAYSIVKSIAALAEELNIEVVAEYVDSKEILDTLKILNIRYAQGFYLAKPIREIEEHDNTF